MEESTLSMPQLLRSSAAELEEQGRSSREAEEQHAARVLQKGWRSRAEVKRAAHFIALVRLARHARPESGMLKRSIASVKRISSSNLHVAKPPSSKGWCLLRVRECAPSQATNLDPAPVCPVWCALKRGT